MLSRSDIVNTLKNASIKYNDIRIGLAGSYANNTAEPTSDIDIVIDGDSMRIDIAQYIKKLFDIKVDILWLDLLKEEDEKLDKLAISIGIPQNEYSVYKTILREVEWI